jgi:hypothetical protein
LVWFSSFCSFGPGFWPGASVYCPQHLVITSGPGLWPRALS